MGLVYKLEGDDQLSMQFPIDYTFFDLLWLAFLFFTNFVGNYFFLRKVSVSYVERTKIYNYEFGDEYYGITLERAGKRKKEAF